MKKRNHNGGHDDFLLNCNIGYKTHTADLALMTSIFTNAFARKFYEQMVTLIQSRSLELY